MLGRATVLLILGRAAADEDDYVWHKRDNPSKGCDWVAAYVPTRCAVKGEDGTTGAASCDACASIVDLAAFTGTFIGGKITVNKNGKLVTLTRLSLVVDDDGALRGVNEWADASGTEFGFDEAGDPVDTNAENVIGVVDSLGIGLFVEMNSQQGTGEVQFDGAELVLRFTQPYPYPVVYSARLRKTSDEPASEVPPWDDLESPT